MLKVEGKKGTKAKVIDAKKGSFSTRLKVAERKILNLENHNRKQTSTINTLNTNIGRLHSAHMKLIDILKEKKLIGSATEKPKKKS